MKKRIVDNRNRPAQPEPGADPAVKKTRRKPAVKRTVKRARPKK